MNIAIHRTKKRPDSQTIDDFADDHKLTMAVKEREDWICSDGTPRFYAQFQYADVRKDGELLWICIGNGNTPKRAIRDYAKKISEAILLTGMPWQTKEIEVPRLVARKAKLINQIKL